ncbi:MAG: gamma-glutamylcyclotransferase [Burkholderiales bacterium]
MLARRGTREQPGLVLGLKPGGACRGVALRLPAPLALDELKLLWRREMVVGSYKPVWVRANAGERTITALAFTVKRDHPQYAHLTLAQEARVIATACGAFGSSCDYLMHNAQCARGAWHRRSIPRRCPKQCGRSSPVAGRGTPKRRSGRCCEAGRRCAVGALERRWGGSRSGRAAGPSRTAHRLDRT